MAWEGHDMTHYKEMKQIQLVQQGHQVSVLLCEMYRHVTNKNAYPTPRGMCLTSVLEAVHVQAQSTFVTCDACTAQR